MSIANVADDSTFGKYLKKQITNKLEKEDSDSSGKSLFDIFSTGSSSGGIGAKLANHAKKFLGANEADGTSNKFVKGGDSKAIAWCAAYVQYSVEDSGIKAPSWYKNIGNKWYCPTIYEAANKAHAIKKTKDAKEGDLVLFDWNGDGVRQHIGIVTSNKNGKITTIEGNSSNQVKYNTYNTNDSRLTICKMA